MAITIIAQRDKLFDLIDRNGYCGSLISTDNPRHWRASPYLVRCLGLANDSLRFTTDTTAAQAAEYLSDRQNHQMLVELYDEIELLNKAETEGL